MGMSLRVKLASGFGVILLIFAISGSLAMLALRAQRETLGMLGRHELPTINLLQEASLDMQLYRKAEKDILLNMGDSKALKGYLGKLDEIASELGETLRKLEAALRGNPQAGAKAEAQAQEAAQAFARDLESKSVVIKMKAGEGGKVFGSVSSKEIATAFKEQCDVDIDKKKIQLTDAIKAFGTYEVPVRLHQQVTGKLKVKVEE